MYFTNGFVSETIHSNLNKIQSEIVDIIDITL